MTRVKCFASAASLAMHLGLSHSRKDDMIGALGSNHGHREKSSDITDSTPPSWWIDYDYLKCVQNCDGPSPCGGRPYRWADTYGDEAECCSALFGTSPPTGRCAELAVRSRAPTLSPTPAGPTGGTPCGTDVILCEARCLYQSDFALGTKRITEPGIYKLCEDVSFAPGKPDSLASTDEEIVSAFDPLATGDEYASNEFSLGFFAALSVVSDDVTLLLNGHTIQQDPSHSLMQRFFAVIELASAPFIPNAGPANFVSDGGRGFVSAKNFVLKGPGTIGRSSHHSIHGNNNENVAISNVVFRDFEVAAVSLNNVKGLSIRGCHIPHNRLDVPVLGSFSAARFVLPYLKVLKDGDRPYSMQLRGVQTSSEAIYDSLATSIANVYRDVMQTGFIDPSLHPMEHKLFHNPHHAVDGPCYAFLVHGKGPAIGGTGFELAKNQTVISSNVDISGNNIDFLKCWTNEIPAAVVNNTVQNDARGAILQLISTLSNEWLASDDSYHYIGNVITDAQIMVASAIRDEVLPDGNILQIGGNTIGDEIINWASDPSATFVPNFRCNGDSMHHVVKGQIIIRVEDTKGFRINDNTIGSTLMSSGPAAASPDYFSQFDDSHGAVWNCSDYHRGNSVEDGTEQQLANLRGISVAAVSRFARSSESTISGNVMRNFTSENANCIVGIDVQGVSEHVVISDNYVNLREGVGPDPDDEYFACRVRKFSSLATIRTVNNVELQEEFLEPRSDGDLAELQIPEDDYVELEWVRNPRNLRWRKIPDNHLIPLETEWDNGGCPFGRS